MAATNVNYKCIKEKKMEDGKFTCESCGMEYYDKKRRECIWCSRTICEYCENEGCKCQDDNDED